MIQLAPTKLTALKTWVRVVDGIPEAAIATKEYEHEPPATDSFHWVEIDSRQMETIMTIADIYIKYQE